MTAYIVLVSRLFYLQIIEGREYRRLSENNCIRLQRIEPQRGMILDRNGVLLVDNHPSFDLVVTPKDAVPLKKTARTISELLGVSYSSIYAEIDSQKQPAYLPVVIKQDIGRDTLGIVEVHKYELPGVTVVVKPKRNYVNGDSAAHLLGYVGEISPRELKMDFYRDYRVGDKVGKYGVERLCEQVLRGKPGGRQVEADVKGRIVRVIENVSPVSGGKLYLTIDHRLQKMGEKLMADKAGAVVVMDATNGEILALISSPAFNPNDFANGISHEKWNALISDEGRPLRNKAVSSEYPPASTYKIITAMAALEEGIIDENTTHFCGGYYEYGGRQFRCWNRWGHGRVNVVDALAESCDVFFYQVGQKLGVDRLEKYAKGCGLGSKTGIGISHEASGLIPSSSWKKRRFGVPWQGGETLSVAIGQSYNLVTPIQMLIAIAAVQNHGYRLKPSIIRAIGEKDAEYKKNTAGMNSRFSGMLPVKDKHLEIVRKGLLKAVNGGQGTARVMRINGIEIGGKTGTAQVVGRKEGSKKWSADYPEHLKPHAWMIAYANSQEYKISVVVFVEHGEHGSGTAAPIARDMIKYYDRLQKESNGKVMPSGS